MNSESRRDLQVLNAIAEDQCLTQRRLSSRLGMALGLTNLYLKRLARKGWIKCVNVRSNRLRYLLTPRGIAEKTRLTYEFMQESLALYRHVREHLRDTLQSMPAAPGMRIAVYGTGEAAELAYVSLRELELEPAAILGDVGCGRFLGLPVFDIKEHPVAEYDVVIVATLDGHDPMLDELARRGVAEDRIVTLRRSARLGRAGRRRRAGLTE